MKNICTCNIQYIPPPGVQDFQLYHLQRRPPNDYSNKPVGRLSHSLASGYCSDSPRNRLFGCHSMMTTFIFLYKTSQNSLAATDT
jgi:hypothetical protein